MEEEKKTYEENKHTLHVTENSPLLHSQNYEKNQEALQWRVIFQTFLVHIVLFTIHTLWALDDVLEKWIFEGNYFSPFLFLSVRLIAATPLLLLLLATPSKLLKALTPEKNIYFLYFAALGVIFAIQQSAFIVGIKYTTASNAATLVCLSPAWTMFLSVLLKREKFLWLKLIGIVLCVFGTFFIVNAFSLSLSDGRLGDILILISSIAYSLFVIGEELLTKLSNNSQQVLIYCVGYCVVISSTIALIFEFEQVIGVFDVPLIAWSAILYSGIFTSVCFSLLGWCLRYTTPIVVMAYLPIEPISAALLASWLIDEKITKMFVIGGVIILGGLIFVILGRHKELKESNLSSPSGIGSPFSRKSSLFLSTPNPNTSEHIF